MADPEEIVGHKTIATGERGPHGLPFMRHEPLTRSEADALWERAEQHQRQRAADMPTEEAAVTTMMQAWLRLKELGWKEARYVPADTKEWHLIEIGSSGIHVGHRMEGERDCWWIAEAGDLWPSRPCLVKPITGANVRGGA